MRNGAWWSSRITVIHRALPYSPIRASPNSRRKHARNLREREIRARFAFFFLFSLFSLFSRRYFYRQSERVNGFSEYGSSVFAVTWCIKKKQRQYTMDKISIKSLPLVSNWRTTTSYRLIFKLGFKRGAVNNLHVASVWDFLFYKNQNNLARDM